MTRTRLACATFAVVVSGCAAVPEDRGHDEIARLVDERSGFDTGWKAGRPNPEEVRQQVRELLQDGLRADEAVRIALVHGPSLQAEFESLGIAQSELWQASVPSNPSLGVALGFPHQAGATTAVTFSLVQELLDLAVLPARRTLASAEFRANTLRLADHALEVVTQTRVLFAEVQAAQMLVDERLVMVAATEAAMRMATLQFEAGNVSQLVVAVEVAAWQEARAEYVREELELRERREALTRLLGLWGPEAQWRISQPLPQPPAADPTPGSLEPAALRRRLDVAARRQELELVDRALSLTRSTWAFGRIEVGIESEREAEGLRTTGPSLVLELPIFDRRQAVVAGLEAERRVAERRLAEVAVNARSEVRLNRARLVAARRLVEHYRTAVLPAKRQIVEQSQLHFNAMAISPYQLFEARQDFAQARRAYIQTLAEYWSARARLERAAGGPLVEDDE